MSLLKKRIVTASASIVILSGFLMSVKADGEVVNPKESLEPVFENMIEIAREEDSIEYMKSYAGGEDDTPYYEVYRDKANKVEQSDTYDENGELISRYVMDSKNHEYYSVGIDDIEGITAISWELDEKIKEYNSEILEVCIIEASLEDTYKTLQDKTWTKYNTEDKNIDKYSSDNTNLYVDNERNIIIKREYIENGQIIEDIEYDIVKNDESLFKVDSPINGVKDNENPLKDIEIKYYEADKSYDFENSVG